MKQINRFLIYTNIEKDRELEISKRLQSYIEVRQKSVILVSSSEIDESNGIIREDIISDIDLVIVLGGDGTMLRAAHAIGNHDVYMIGVNLGTLGFLTEVDIYHMEQMIDRLISGDYMIEERMMLTGSIESGTFTGVTQYALNDIVLSRSGILRLIALNIYVNDQFLDTYEADGVILSTPTGSTGYNLSAGGPIVTPMAKLMLLTPICPHSLSKKSVVFTPNDRIRIEIVAKRKTQETESIVSFDGYENYNLSVGDTLEISAAERSIHLVKMYDVNFYEVLRNKIGGES